MKTMNSYSKHIALLFFTLLSSCTLIAQTKSTITRLAYCYDSDNVEFKYNFKNAGIDTVSFTISFYDESELMDKTITFIKKSKERIVLHGIGNKISIHYIEGGKMRSRNVNLLNYQCKGKRPTKKDDK